MTDDRPPFVDPLGERLVEQAYRHVARRRRRTRTAALVAVVAFVGAGVGVASQLSSDEVDAGQRVEVADRPDATDLGPPTPTSEPTPSAEAVVEPTVGDDAAVTQFFPADVAGLPARYVAMATDGEVVLVETATGRGRTLFEGTAPDLHGYSRLRSLAPTPDGAAVYVSIETADCAGRIVRVPFDGGPVEEVAAGAHPLVSPDGRWLVHTIDGFARRGEAPPPRSDPDDPCSRRHDSYVWRDLATGDEIEWVDPDGRQPCCDLLPASFDPTGTRLLLYGSHVELGVSIVTPAEPEPGLVPVSTPLLLSAAHWLPDGELLVAGEGDGPLPSGVRQFAPPAGYQVRPVDTTQAAILVSGLRSGEVHGDVAASVWAMRGEGEPILLARSALVRWVPGELLTGDSEPSQNRADAERDGVPSAVASLPVAERAQGWRLETDQGTWVLNRLDEAGGYGYGEVVLVDSEGRLVKAWPMPELPPNWAIVTDTTILGGRIGDGALGASTVFTIDRETLELTTAIAIPPPVDQPTSYPDGWTAAHPAQVAAWSAAILDSGPERAPEAPAGRPADVSLNPLSVEIEHLERFVLADPFPVERTCVWTVDRVDSSAGGRHDVRLVNDSGADCAVPEVVGTEPDGYPIAGGDVRSDIGTVRPGGQVQIHLEMPTTCIALDLDEASRPPSTVRLWLTDLAVVEVAVPARHTSCGVGFRGASMVPE